MASWEAAEREQHQLRENLFSPHLLPYITLMDGMSLPPDLEKFATDAVAAGRYRNVGEVVAAGIGLLQRTEAQREALLVSVQAAEARGETEGFLTVEEVMEDADALIEEMSGTRR